MGYTSSPGAIIRMGVEGAEASVRQVDQVAGSYNRLADTITSVTRKLAATIGIGGGLAEIIQMSDEYTKYNSQLRLATQSEREFAIASADVTRISKESQASLAGTGVLYARIANGTRELGINQSRVAAITEVVNLSLKTSGATTAEAASAQLQLSQAFASGTLRGEEFNAVNEAAPRLMKALADGMGVPIGALKQMASEGKITSQMMSDVLPGALEQLREEAKQVQTIGGAFQVLKDSVMAFTATKAEANGVVSVLTASMGFLATHLGAVTTLLTTMTAVKAANWFSGWAASTYATSMANRELRASTLLALEADVAASAAASALATARVAELRAAVLAAEGNVALAITTNGLIPAQARAIALAEAHTVALAAQTAALAGGASAAGVFRGALAFLGGPLGAIVTVLGVAAAAWSFMGSSAKEGADKSAAAVRETTEEILAGLDKQIDKLKDRNKLARLGIPTAKNESAASNRLGEVVSAIDRAGNATGEYAGLNQDVRIEILKALGREYGDLTVKIAALNAEVEEDASNKNKKSVGEWMVKYANNAEKLKAELDAARKELGAGFTPELEARIRKQFEAKETGSKKEASAYATLSAAVREKIEATHQEAQGLVPLNDAQKLQVVLNEQIRSGKLKITAANKAVYEGELRLLSANIEMIAARKRSAEMDQIQVAYAEQQGKALETALREATANEELARTFGMTKLAIEHETIARMEARAEQMRSIDGADDEVRALELVIAARKRSAAALASVEGQEAAKKARDDLIAEGKKVSDSLRDSLTEGLMRGFENGKGLAENFRDTLVNMFKTLILRPTIQGVLSPISSGISSMLNSGATSALGGAANSAQSGMGLLSSLGSAGSMYSAYTASSLGQFMSGFGGSAGAASQALGAPMTSAASAGSMVSNGLSGTAGVPYLGLAGGGYAAYNVAQNVGGFGGALAGGAAGVGTIAAGGAAVGLASGAGIAAGATAALAAIPIYGWAALAALAIVGSMQDGPEKSTRLKFGSNNAAGNISINERGNEGKSDSYIDKSSTGAFGSFGVVSSFWMSSGQPVVQDFIKTVTQTDDALAQFMTATEKAAVTSGLTNHTATSVSGMEGSDPNGMGGLDGVFQDRILTIFRTLEPGLDSLIAGFKGTSGELATEAAALLSFRSALKDSGEAVFGVKVTLQDLAALKQPLEASSAAMARVTSEFTVTNAVAASLGKSAAAAFGVIGLESLAAREGLVAAAGGVQSLSAMTANFAQNYLSESERLAPVLASVTASMAALGHGSIATRAEFKNLVLGLDLTNAADQKTYASLMSLADAFAATHVDADGLTASVRSAGDILSEHNDLQKQYDELTLTSAQLREKERATIDASNLALFDQITYRQTANAATEALSNTFDSLKSNVASTRSYLSSLNMGSLSTLTPMQKYLEAKREESEALAKAKASPADSAAQAAWQTASTNFLTASQTINASSAAFVADRAKVIADGKSLADIAGAQMSDVQQQLSLAGQQVSSLTTLNSTAVGIQQAIVDLGTSGAIGPVFEAQRYSAAANVGSDVLAAEIKRLNEQIKVLVEETKGRRLEAKGQADGIVDAVDQSAEDFARSLEKSGIEADWKGRNGTQRPARG